MEKIFIFAIIFMIIVVIAMFFFVSQMSIGMGKNVQELSLELDRVSKAHPPYHPLSLGANFAKLVVSFISFFTGS
jgi:hypothetical protein